MTAAQLVAIRCRVPEDRAAELKAVAADMRRAAGSPLWKPLVQPRAAIDRGPAPCVRQALRPLLGVRNADNRAQWIAFAAWLRQQMAVPIDHTKPDPLSVARVARSIQLPASTIDAVLRIERLEARGVGFEVRKAAVVRLAFSAVDRIEIARLVRVSPETVDRVLEAERTLVLALRFLRRPCAP